MELPDLLYNLIKMAAVDQNFAKEELDLLSRRGAGWGIDSEKIDAMIAQATEEVAAGNLTLVIPESIGDREHLLKEMIRVMMIDGKLAMSEKRLCSSAAMQMQFGKEQFLAILGDMMA